ncbi:MAG: arsenate reductase (glutaredoxin) [Bacteroidia bacterium]
MILYHNNRCGKSRDALKLVEESGEKFEVRDYLNNPPSQKEIKELLSKLGLKAEDIIRKKEKIFIENFKNKKLTESQWIKILSENPILIERPILITKTKAVIGRPPELVKKLLKS